MKDDLKKLYSNAWFSMITVMVCTILSAAYPAWGISIAVAYFIGWVAFAQKEKEKEIE